MGLNIGISIAMVLVNKYLYVKVGFPNVTLTLMHFASTFICLHFCQLYGMFPIKKVPITKIIPLSITFCGFVVLTNLSLENNSVGTYQVAKVITTPCVMLIQYYAYGQKFSMNVIFTVIPIVLGVCLNFMYDLKYNTLGTMYALLGVIVTSFYQVLVGAKQKEFQMSSMQLLYYQAPISAVILIVPMLIFEPVSNITDASWELIEVGAVLFSCLMAFGVNLSIYWIIGNTSALTYNMAGHIKFCLLIATGFLLFDEPLSVNQIFGLVLTLTGVITYTHLRMKEQNMKNISQSS